MKRPRWSSGVPSDGHTKLIDTAGRAFIVQETGVLRFELLKLPDPPPLAPGEGVETAKRRVSPRKSRG